MKYVLYVFATLFVIGLTSCSKDDDGEESPSLDYIQIRVFSEDALAPNGNVYLFYVENYINKISSMKPSTVIEWTPTISYTSNHESHIMTPVSKYGSKYKGDLLCCDEEGYSVYSIYWNKLSTLYGTPKPGGKYVLMVDLRSPIFPKAYRELTISKNSIVEVHFPKLSNPYESGWVDAEFVVRDYVTDN